MKTPSKITIFSLLIILFSGTASSLTVRSKYGPQATPLHKAHDYFKKAAAPDYWVLSPYYMAQQDGRSCSVATVAMIVNAARTHLDLNSEDPLVTQKNILKKTNDSSWMRNVGPLGHGVTLDELGAILEKSLHTYGLSQVHTEITHVDDTSSGSRKKLHEALIKNERSDRDFIAINFIQGVYTSDTGGGHIAVVGAYDAEKKRVLIFDPDREWYEPYWVSEDAFIKGMATQDPVSGKSRGYVWISIRK